MESDLEAAFWVPSASFWVLSDSFSVGIEEPWFDDLCVGGISRCHGRQRRRYSYGYSPELMNVSLSDDEVPLLPLEIRNEWPV